MVYNTRIMKPNRQAFNRTASHPLQSWEWGEFRTQWGNKVVRFPFGQLTVHKIPLTPFSVSVFSKGPAPTETMLDELKKYAKENGILFVKLEPNVKDNKLDKIILSAAGAIPGKTLFTETTFWIDLKRSEDALLSGFHQKTRYNIRLAQKKGVKVEEDNSDAAFERYLALTKETATRQGFYAHSERYHRMMWKTLHTDMVKKGNRPIAHLMTAIYGGEIIATWILFVWKDFLYFPYGASTDAYKNVMAPNLLLWESIRFGKKHGLKTFDLWGREIGKGFTKFKEGYNPEIVTFLGTWDLVCSPLYWLYRLAEWCRWKILRIKSRFLKPRF